MNPITTPPQEPKAARPQSKYDARLTKRIETGDSEYPHEKSNAGLHNESSLAPLT